MNPARRRFRRVTQRRDLEIPPERTVGSERAPDVRRATNHLDLDAF
jgi:hypothetical protein